MGGLPRASPKRPKDGFDVPSCPRLLTAEHGRPDVAGSMVHRALTARLGPALAADLQIVIFDEPTAHLDRRVEE